MTLYRIVRPLLIAAFLAAFAAVSLSQDATSDAAKQQEEKASQH